VTDSDNARNIVWICTFYLSECSKIWYFYVYNSKLVGFLLVQYVFGVKIMYGHMAK